LSGVLLYSQEVRRDQHVVSRLFNRGIRRHVLDRWLLFCLLEEI
jgi:truncated hemoglobin YjbI